MHACMQLCERWPCHGRHLWSVLPSYPLSSYSSCDTPVSHFPPSSFSSSSLTPHSSLFPSADNQEAIQWFGIDVGGTLVKAVYYETQNDKTDPLTEGEGVAAMKKFIKSNLKYGSTGIRDQRLEMHGQNIGGYTGTLHFIKFATNRMCGFFDMATNNGLARFPKVVCATGGGAFKFESAFKEVSFLPLCLTSLNFRNNESHL